MQTETKLQERYLVLNQLDESRPYRVVGSAYRYQDTDEFTLFLRILPGVKFYVVPHRDRMGWEYVIFSGKSETADGSRFFSKVGSAVLIPKKNVIEIHLPDLRQVYFLQLDPKDFHFDARSAARAA